MGILGGCTFPLLYHVLDLRTFHSTSCLGLLLTRDLFWSCPGLLDVVEQGTGGFGREVGSPSPQRNLCNLSSLSSPTSLCLFVCLFVSVCLFRRKFGAPSHQGDSTKDPTTWGPHQPPGTLLACRASMLTPVSRDRHGDSSFQGPPAWRICAIGLPINAS